MIQTASTQLMSVKDLAQYLGIKQSTLYSWASRGLIPHYKINGLLRFKKEEIDPWIDSSRHSKSDTPLLSVQRKNQGELDLIIASAKRGAYNVVNGKPGQIKSRGRRSHGTL